MRTLGICLALLGFALVSFGLLADISVPGVSIPGFGLPDRIANLSLMAQQGALVTAGGAFMISGTVLFAASEILISLNALRNSSKPTTPAAPPGEHWVNPRHRSQA
jgi:hypothetical protein